MKWDHGVSRAVELAWKNKNTLQPASYTLSLDTALRADSCITFSIANGSKNAQEPPLDFTIAISDASGNKGKTSLGVYRPLYPQLINKPRIDELTRDTSFSEPVMQYYNYPLSLFLDDSEQINMEEITALHFIFDKSAAGHIILDDIMLSSFSSGEKCRSTQSAKQQPR